MALVAGGVILNFQCIQTYVIDAFTLHAASGERPPNHLFSSEYLDYPSSRCRRVSPFTLRVRLPTICACHVQSTRIWKGRHHSCCSCYRYRVPRVRSFGFSASYNCLCHPMRLDHFYSGNTANVYDTQADMLHKLTFFVQLLCL